ncbi:hypothetical protein [Oceanirhabdus sp. W0125-5]|uniref:hypothetical protein n=1 Tax=Oceanirhabdus sp. W0125-5 TaxID=2999116 RepID=UPI0022F2D77C|nr:hypothetical protein [Oceanirhabdus sp. W0125-5]WBW97510.1 hypothetical protein OW730_01315 [Oceanirhabdus sp. W0125-5]
MRDRVIKLNSENKLDTLIEQEIVLQKEVREKIDLKLESINTNNVDIQETFKKGDKPYYKFKELLNKEIEISTSVVAFFLVIILTSSLIFNINSIKVNAQEIRNSKIKVECLGGDNK